MGARLESLKKRVFSGFFFPVALRKFKQAASLGFRIPLNTAFYLAQLIKVE